MEIVKMRPAVERRRSKIIAGSAEAAVKELVRLLKAEARVI
jgi:electron transfer flavoprotein alpha/beta subunit